MTTTIESRKAIATARDAGRNVVHTVTVVCYDGIGNEVDRYEAISGTRRSAHRYSFAVCRWTTERDGRRNVVVVRWSRNAKATGATFAVPVHTV